MKGHDSWKLEMLVEIYSMSSICTITISPCCWTLAGLFVFD